MLSIVEVEWESEKLMEGDMPNLMLYAVKGWFSSKLYWLNISNIGKYKQSLEWEWRSPAIALTNLWKLIVVIYNEQVQDCQFRMWSHRTCKDLFKCPD